MRKKIKCAVIGCGLWGHHHAAVYNEGIYSELVAVCDKDIDKAKAFSKEFKVNCYSGVEKMFEAEDIDAVGIATPDFAHLEPLLSAISHSKNILCEKPITINPEDLEKIVTAVNKHKVRIMVDYHMRYIPAFVEPKNQLEEGRLGTPINIYMRQNDSICFATGKSEWTISWAEKSSALWFLGAHTVDAVSWFFNDRVKRVFSVSHEGVLMEKGVNTPDTYLTTLEFENGGIAQIENGWITPDGNPSIIDVKCNILCTKGLVNIDLSSNNFLNIFTEDRVINPDFWIKPNYYGLVYGIVFESIRDFVRKLYFEEDFKVSFDSSVDANKVLFSIFESSKEREPIKVKY